MKATDRKILAGIRREREVELMRLGIRQRATTVPDKRKKASKEACRDRRSW